MIQASTGIIAHDQVNTFAHEKNNGAKVLISIQTTARLFYAGLPENYPGELPAPGFPGIIKSFNKRFF
jgi:hypothetical protein